MNQANKIIIPFKIIIFKESLEVTLEEVYVHLPFLQERQLSSAHLNAQALGESQKDFHFSFGFPLRF